MANEPELGPRVQSVKDLDPPLVVGHCAGYATHPDRAGVVWFTIHDRNSRWTQVCIDGREDSQTRWRLFDGDRHPRKSSAVLVELGDKIEGIVIPLISRWLDSGDARQLGVTDWFYERAREAVTRIGEP